MKKRMTIQDKTEAAMKKRGNRLKKTYCIFMAFSGMSFTQKAGPLNSI